MIQKNIYYAGLLGLATLFASCSSDDVKTEPKQASEVNTKGLTEFAVTEERSANAKSLLSTGIYSGSGIDFYWTANDNLWVNDGGTLRASTSDNISTQLTASGDTKAATAKFYFSGKFTASSYPVRFTGTSSTVGNKVTIKAAQAQANPNDGSHIGADGDCGVATATQNSTNDGYEFTLSHKASYLTFMPIYTGHAGQGFANTVKVLSIKVSANENLAGTYDFDDNGLSTSTPTSASKSVTLTLGGANGFAIPTTKTASSNASIMVVAPGSYTDFTVEYTLHDSYTNVTGTVKKNYGSVTCTAGKNKLIAQNLSASQGQNLGVTQYSTDYYMWDAKANYWSGYESVQPLVDNGANGNYPQNAATGGNRWYNTAVSTNTTTNSYVTGSNTCSEAQCPTVNSLTWYVWNGDPRWEDLLWNMNGHLYSGGMWFKKSTKISGFHAYSYNGTDYRKTSMPGTDMNGNPAWKKTPGQGRPSDVNDYFFLPAKGYYENGTLRLNYAGYKGAYWTANDVYFSGHRTFALALYFDKTTIGIDSDERIWGYPNGTSYGTTLWK